jgi:hypothetical protein
MVSPEPPKLSAAGLVNSIFPSLRGRSAAMIGGATAVIVAPVSIRAGC